jgi:membrane associated rhomboid family serine protease
MLDDRDYMRRRGAFEPQWSMTVILIIINVIVFVFQNVAAHYQPRLFSDFFVLSIDGLKQGYVWQLITFQFLHQDLLHIFGNMLSVYFFGRAVEEALGRTSFLKLYLLSGALGGLFEMGGRLLWPEHFGASVLGASAGAYGLIAAYASLFAHRSMQLIFPPIEIKVRLLLWLGIAFSIFGIISPFGSMAHGAHLGGILTGLAYIHWITNTQKPLAWHPFRAKARRRELVKVRSEKPQNWQRPKNIVPEEIPPAEFISKEVDPILDKISAHGIQSLTERERQILEAARARMSKR